MLGKVCKEVNEEAHMPSTPTRDLPEEFLAATRKSQEVMIRAIRTWVETVRTVTPKLPSAYAPLADRLPKLPAGTRPFADKLPKPEEVVANGYDFAEHLLAIQRKFAEDVLAATEPLIPGTVKRTRTDPSARTEAARNEATVPVEKAVAAQKAAVTETAKAASNAVTEPTKAVTEDAKPAPAPTGATGRAASALLPNLRASVRAEAA